MFEGKPIIGIAGGIGSGKSFVAKLLAEAGCLVIHSDEMAHQAYKSPLVKSTLRQWWGSLVFDGRGEVDRSTVARKIFTSPSERRRLEQLIHPIVNQERERIMKSAALDPNIKAYVWDTPLLFETGLNKLCDAVIFVDAPLEVRLSRVAGRGWGREELAKRENSQMALDMKAKISDHSVLNASEAQTVGGQVREVLSRILDKNRSSTPGKS